MSAWRTSFTLIHSFENFALCDKISIKTWEVDGLVDRHRTQKCGFGRALECWSGAHFYNRLHWARACSPIGPCARALLAALMCVRVRACVRVCDACVCVMRACVCVCDACVCVCVMCACVRASPQRHSNASQSLCEIIRLSRDQMFQVQGCSEPDPLLSTLEK